MARMKITPAVPKDVERALGMTRKPVPVEVLAEYQHVQLLKEALRHYTSEIPPFADQKMGLVSIGDEKVVWYVNNNGQPFAQTVLVALGWRSEQSPYFFWALDHGESRRIVAAKAQKTNTAYFEWHGVQRGLSTEPIVWAYGHPSVFANADATLSSPARMMRFVEADKKNAETTCEILGACLVTSPRQIAAKSDESREGSGVKTTETTPERMGRNLATSEKRKVVESESYRDDSAVESTHGQEMIDANVNFTPMKASGVNDKKTKRVAGRTIGKKVKFAGSEVADNNRDTIIVASPVQERIKPYYQPRISVTTPTKPEASRYVMTASASRPNVPGILKNATLQAQSNPEPSESLLSFDRQKKTTLRVSSGTDSGSVSIKLSSCNTIETLFDMLHFVGEVGKKEGTEIAEVQAIFVWLKEEQEKEIRLFREVPDSFDMMLKIINDAPCWELRRKNKCVVHLTIHIHPKCT